MPSAAHPASVLCQGGAPGPSDTARTPRWPERPVGSEPAGSRCAQSLLLVMGVGLSRETGCNREDARETAVKVARLACRGRRRRPSRHLRHWSAPHATERSLCQAMTDCSREDAQATPGKVVPPSHRLPQCSPALRPHQVESCGHRVRSATSLLRDPHRERDPAGTPVALWSCSRGNPSSVCGRAQLAPAQIQGLVRTGCAQMQLVALAPIQGWVRSVFAQAQLALAPIQGLVRNV